jgi:excisionase family DNA binding protein
MSAPPPSLVPAALLARYLCVSGSTVRRWIQAGHLTAYRLGGPHARYRVDIEDVKRFYWTKAGAAAIARNAHNGRGW